MQLSAPTRRLGAATEHTFLLHDVPGLLWLPQQAPAPVPLILLGHPGGLETIYPRLAQRARRAVADGFAAAAIELSGSGNRAKIGALEEARATLRRAVLAGETVTGDVVDQLVLPLLDLALPESQAALDALLDMEQIRGPVGLSGGNISLCVRLAACDGRIAAAVLYAGSFVPRAIFADAARISIPLHVLLQWDDESNDRQASLALFDAFGSHEKSLHAHMGGHTGVPAPAREEAQRFLARNLR